MQDSVLWMRSGRSSAEAAPLPPRGLHQDGLLQRGKVSGSLSPPKSHCSVLSKSALPEQLLQNCTRISIQEKTHQGHGPKRQARFSGLGGSLGAVDILRGRGRGLGSSLALSWEASPQVSPHGLFAAGALCSCQGHQSSAGLKSRPGRDHGHRARTPLLPG